MSSVFHTDLNYESKSLIIKYNWLRALKTSLFGRCQPIRSRTLRTSRLHLEQIEDRVVPSAFMVNVLGDSSGSNGGSGSGLSGDLRWCLSQALSNTETDTISFDATVFGSAQTINLSSTLSTDTSGANRFGPTAFVIEKDDITITGSTAGVTLNGGGALRLFAVTSNATLTLQNLTLRGGSATGTDGTGGGGGGGAGLGGAVFVDGGNLTVRGSTFANNTARGGTGAGIAADGGAGGGLGGPGVAGTFGVGGVGGVETSNGTSGGFGGGGGGGTIGVGGVGGFGGGGGGDKGSSTPGGFGGGAAGSFFSGGGGGGLGGAIFNNQGVVNLINDTFTANTATGGAGGSSGSGLGGAVFTRNGTLNATYVTFSLNTANQGGTDVFVVSDGGDGGNNTSPGTGTAAVNLTNSILGQSGPTSVSDFIAFGVNDGAAPTQGGTNNLISLNHPVLGFTGGVVFGSDPLLDTLASNGGPTQTMAILPDSPSFGAGVVVGDITTDQRGFPRPAAGPTDIGAYQSVVLTAAPVVTTPATAVSVNTGTYDIAGTAEAGSLVRVYQDVNNNGEIDAGDTVVAQQQLGVGLTDFSIGTPLTANAANNFLVTATGVNAESLVTDVPTITRDSIAPAAPVVTNPATAQTVNSASFNITGTADDFSLVKVYVDVNNNGVIDIGDNLVDQQEVGVGGAFSLSLTLTRNAANNFLVTATDAVGNASVVADVPTITEDSIAPAAATVTSPAAPLTLNADTYDVTGTAEAGSLVEVYADLNNNGELDEGEMLVGTLQLGAGVTGFSITVPLTQDDDNNFLVRSTDAAGNRSLADVPTITEDSLAPKSISVTTPAEAVTAGTATATVAGTTDTFSLVKVYRDVNNNGVIDEGDVVVAQVQIGETNAYSLEVPLTPNAANNFLVTATDLAGNESGVADVPTITQFSPAVTVSGVVFLDYSADGVRNGPDVGLAGRRVYIDANSNGAFDNGEVSTFTDGNGAYRIDGVGAGANRLRVELFPSEVIVGGPDSGTVTVTAGQPVTGADLGLRKLNPAFAVATTTDLYGSDNPNLETALVRGLFASVLGRQGSAGEVQGCVAFLQSGGSLAVLGRLFLTCDEYLGNQVDASFRVYLGRDAEPLSRAVLVGLLRQGMPYEELATLFLSSGEYQARYPDAEGFVRSLFSNQLGREGSDAEVQGLTAALASGFSRAALARAFVCSPESYLRGIDSLYAQFLNRPGEDAGRIGWLAFVSGGGRLTDLAVQFVTLPEFSARAAATVG